MLQSFLVLQDHGNQHQSHNTANAVFKFISICIRSLCEALNRTSQSSVYKMTFFQMTPFVVELLEYC